MLHLFYIFTFIIGIEHCLLTTLLH